MQANRTGVWGLGRSWAWGVVLAGVVLPAAGRTARAQFMDYTDQTRTVSAASTGSTTVTNSAPDYLPWSSEAHLLTAHATQDSTLGGTSITVAASADGYAPSPPVGGDPMATNIASGDSDLDAVFEIAQPYNYQISGALSADRLGPGSFAFARVRLVDQDDVTVFAISRTFGGNLPFGFSGVLPAGRYWLDMAVHAQGANGLDNGPSNGTADMSFTFTLTPEPGSLALLVCGLGLVGRRRR